MKSDDGVKQKIIQKTLDYISYRPRSLHEVQVKVGALVKKYLHTADPSEEEKISAELLQYLKELSLLSDKQNIQLYVDSFLHSSKPKGINYIKRFLQQKGFVARDIEQVLGFMMTGANTALLVSQVERKFHISLVDSKLSNTEKYKLKNKIYRFLTSRGFTSSEINAVVDTFPALK